MKLEAKEFDGSNHKRLVTETGKDIGLLYLDVDGYYYYEPNEGKGTFSAYHLRVIADFLDEINKPYDNKVKEFFSDREDSKKKSSRGVGSKVKIKNRGSIYTTYEDMFIRLGFKNPKESKYLQQVPNKLIEDKIFTVFNKGTHRDNSTKLYAIRDDEGNEYLFSKKGLKFL